MATRLGRQAAVGISSRYSTPAELRRALEEAELVLEVSRDGQGPGEEIGDTTYRLLFRVLASHPEEVRAFFEDTVAPIVRYDEQYSTDLVATLAAYLGENCNMNATAASIYAHRHTVSYRLERIRELTGLDPLTSEDRERLGLGLKAYRIIAPTLPQIAGGCDAPDPCGDSSVSYATFRTVTYQTRLATWRIAPAKFRHRTRAARAGRNTVTQRQP